MKVTINRPDGSYSTLSNDGAGTTVTQDFDVNGNQTDTSVAVTSSLPGGDSEEAVAYTYTDGSTYSTDTVTQPDGAYQQTWSRSDGTSGSTNGIAAVVQGDILVLGAWKVMHSADFTVGMLVAFQMFASRLSQPMLRLVGLWQQFQQANLSVARLGDVMNAPTEPYSISPTRSGQGRGQIDIEALAFRYSDQLPFLYQNFDLKVEPGRVVVIMGPSGSGKSTLTKLLQGFYLPSSGGIRLDGTDVRHLSANELRSNFGVVPQETVLFSGTVYENLQMANPRASFDDIVQACRMAEIHAFIEKLPKGYQTEIGERGAGLSGGQKQRLSIARALIKKPKVLIFDEATSSLDGQTTEHFAATINQLKGKVTMLFITHALPANLKADEIVRIGARAGMNLHSAPEPIQACPIGASSSVDRPSRRVATG